MHLRQTCLAGLKASVRAHKFSYPGPASVWEPKKWASLFARECEPTDTTLATGGFMNSTSTTFWEAAQSMIDKFIARLPSLIVGIIVFLLFYMLSIVVSRTILRTTRKYRPNLGVVFARLTGATTILFGFLVAFSVVAPSFQAGDLIKILGISGVAIGFAFQNILQNFLAGLLLLWAEPFRVGDEIKLDNYEGKVEDIQARATIIETYDGRRVVIPNADLFTHSVIVNTALDLRRWEYDLTVKGERGLAELKVFICRIVSKVNGVLSDPSPEVLVMDLGDPGSNMVKVRVLWWTKSSRQHEMLASYDRVLTAIRQTLDCSTVGADRVAA
jgi:small conductance mechanosensitive channel